MKNILLISLLFTLLATVGCRKAMDAHGRDGQVEIKFATPLLTIQKADMLTRATPENLPENTPIDVKVFKANETDFSKTVLQVVYLASRDGYAVPKTENDRLFLPDGMYDIYFFLPQPATTMTNAGTMTINNGVDFMAVKKTITVDMATNDGSQTVDVNFSHLCAAVNLELKAEKNIISLAMDECRIEALPPVATYDLPTATLTADPALTGSVTIPTADFTISGEADLTTMKMKVPAVILVGAATTPKIVIPMQINGVSQNVTFDFSAAIAAGYQYNVTLTVNAQGTPTKFEVTVAPWGGGTPLNGSAAEPIRIGSWRAGGVVFWIDPADDTHYKVVDAGERFGVTWHQAEAYAAANGSKWRLPLVSELTEIYNLRAASPGNSALDKSLVEHFGRAISEGAYWSSKLSDVDATATAVDLTTGSESSNDITALLHARAVKEVLPLLPPANCYVGYPKEGVYLPIMFNALKKPIAKYAKGNATPVNVKGSNPSTADVGLENDIVYQAGDGLAISWQTAVNHQLSSNGMVIKSVSLDTEGVATVQVNGPGNAVLAYTRGTDTLWNYHIWVTDSNPFTTFYATGGDVNGKAEGGTQAGFMDRNLGALSATATKPAAADAYKYFGVVYQHGRPTPFTGQGTGTTANQYTNMYKGNGRQFPPFPIGGHTQSTTAVTSVTAAIKTPNTYYYKEVVQYYYSWFSVDISPWSDYGTNKSIYDPCPYGYRVPKEGSWNSWSSTSSFTQAIDGGAVWSSTWWPAAGSRTNNGGAIGDVGGYAYYWSSSRHSTAYSSYYLDFRNNGYVGPSNASGRSYGFSVRCVQEGY